MRRLDQALASLEGMACAPGDDAAARTRKAQFALAMTLIVPAGLLWGLIYVAFGGSLAAVSPLAYAGLSVANLALLQRTRRFRLYQRIELAMILVAPVALQLILDGYVGGSAVVVWAFLSPLFALLFTTPREAAVWFGLFLAAVIGVGVAQPHLHHDNALAPGVVVLLFVMNLGAVSAVAFAVLYSFMGARDRLRQLELAYLEQHVMLRQREKLATLGTLAAGVAHELNNPAAAVQRAAQQLRPTLDALTRTSQDVSAVPLAADQQARLADLAHRAVTAPPATAGSPGGLSPVEQSLAEGEVEDWLADHGVAAPWDLAPTLVAAGYRVGALQALADTFQPAQLGAVAQLLAHTATASQLAGGIADGAARISEIVAALRSYSYLDRGTVQTVDVTEGLESTLVLLRSQLRGMRVVREYADGLPPVEVRGNELNQVWTNIIHNAIDATGGQGTLVLRTSLADGDRIAVELEDDGPGMEPAVAARAFDPFFTTKPPGQGTGLGLNISHNIVVRQHGGSLTVDSAPGRTCFRVELPQRHLAADVPSDVAADVPYGDRAVLGSPNIS